MIDVDSPHPRVDLLEKVMHFLWRRALLIFLPTLMVVGACGSDNGSPDEESSISLVDEDLDETPTSDTASSDTTDSSNLDPTTPAGVSSTTTPSSGSTTTRPGTATSPSSPPANTNPSGGTSDSTGPSIVVSSVTPSSVAVGGTVSVSFSVSDSSGVAFAATFWQSSSGNQVPSCPNGSGLNSTGGPSTNRTYQVQCTLPTSGLPGGTYTVSITATDNAGNNSSLNTTFTFFEVV